MLMIETLMILFLIAIAFILAVVPLLSMRVGLALYLIGALIFPSLWFGEVALRFEVIYCLWLVFVFFLRKAASGFTFRWHPVLSRYGLFLVAVILSTMLAQLSKASEGSLMQSLVSFYGILRPLLVMFLFLNGPVDEKLARRILWAFVWLSVPIALLSIGQTLGLSVAQEITLRGYTSPWRTPVFRLLEKQGRIIRSTGVFESPILNAIYFLMVLIAGGFLLVRGQYKPFHKWGLHPFTWSGTGGWNYDAIFHFSLGIRNCVGSPRGLPLWPRDKRRFLRITVGSTLSWGCLLFRFYHTCYNSLSFQGTSIVSFSESYRTRSYKPVMIQKPEFWRVHTKLSHNGPSLAGG